MNKTQTDTVAQAVATVAAAMKGQPKSAKAKLAAANEFAVQAAIAAVVDAYEMPLTHFAALAKVEETVFWNVSLATTASGKCNLAKAANSVAMDLEIYE